MFIAHVPAGYLLTRTAAPASWTRSPCFWFRALFFSVAPDFDLFWFYLVDNSAPHHTFFPHWPLFWLGLTLIAWGTAVLFRKPWWRPWILLALANVMLHLVLDSVGGIIHWFAPFSMRPVSLVTIPARYDWWVWNFVLHWTFILELAICLAAVTVWHKGRSRAST